MAMQDLEKSFDLFSEATDKLTLSDVSIPHLNEAVMEYKFDNGICIGFDLFTDKDDRIAVQRITIPKGVTFINHSHIEREWYVVYEGTVVVRVKDQEPKTLGPGQGYRFESNQEHEVEALDPVEMVCITIPASKDYPRK